jgi:CheY-like chemotaxis protein
VPRVLIADDDPVSLRFLATAVAGLGCSVIVAANADEAETALGWASFELLLLDRRMPGRGGAELLASLRARGIAVPALATTAEVTPVIAAELSSAGFAGVIEKPVTLAELGRALAPYLDAQPASGVAPQAARSAPTGLALLEDDAALLAVGSDAEALCALRRLFAQELSELETRWSADAQAVEQERLHRLRASCGFCGARALGEAALRLEHALRSHAGDTRALLDDFLTLCRRTRAALDSALASH